MACGIGNGALIKRDGVALGQVKSISGPKIEVDEHEITNLDSTAKEYTPGLPDGGEVEVEFFFQNAVVTTLSADFCDVATWTVVFPDAFSNSTWTFDGFVKTLETEFSNEDPLMLKVSIKVTGLPTWSAG